MNTSTNIKITVFGLLFLGFYYIPSIMIILIQVVVVASMAVGLHQKNTNLMCKSKKLMHGKSVLVTGGTAGIGLKVAADMAHRGAKVIIACPFEDEGQHAKACIEKSSGSEKIFFKLLDLSSLDSVREFASDILKNEDRLDILINNAGIGAPQEKITADGLHAVMQVNYFGTFLLTVLLLPLLIKTGEPSEPSRIVNTASVLHRLGVVDYENWNRINYWNKMRLYANSKLCLVIFTRKLSTILKDTNVVVNAVDPGAVGTAIFKSSGRNLGTFVAFLLRILFKRPWEGAQTTLYVSLSTTAGKMSGKYFRNCQLNLPGRAVYNDEIAKRLWDKTANLVKLKDEWNCNYQIAPGK